MVGTLSMASAREYSIWEWWTDNAFNAIDDVTPISPPWGSAYAGLSHDDLWDNYQVLAQNQTWTVPDPSPLEVIRGKGILHVEYAGWATSNTFGWYNPVLPDAIATSNEIFSGAATMGATFDIDFTGYVGESIGFYMTAPNGGYTWYSEGDRNTSDSSTRHVRVFNHPDDADSWILAWEDRAMSVDGYNYAGAWDKDLEPLKWYNKSEPNDEPDYNDMILTFRWEAENNFNSPELSTFLLLGLSLAAVPVLRRRRRA